MEQAEALAPVMRPDLVFRPLAGGRVFISHPEVTAQIVSPEVAEVVRTCRGQPMMDLVCQASEILGWRFTEKEWYDFLIQLADCGYFRDRPKRNPRVRLFDPGPAIEFLTRKCRWLFTVPAVLALFALLLAGIWQLLGHWDFFASEVLRIAQAYPAPTVLLFYLCFVPVGLLHELAHGVVCHWFGGEVLEVGLKKNSANLYVLSNTAPLTAPRARILYFSGGAFLDMLIFFGLVNLWLLWPNFLSLMFLLPQALFVLQFSYAMENGSDLSRIVSIWLQLPEAEGRWAFVRSFSKQRPQSTAEWKRAGIYFGSIILQGTVAASLIWSFREAVEITPFPGIKLAVPFWPVILFVLYRWLRKGLLALPDLLKPPAPAQT